METKSILTTEIGTLESEKLQPKDVIIKSLRVDEVTLEKGKVKKAVFLCLYPEKVDLLEVSSVRYEKSGELVNSGLWVKLDKDNNLQKGSALTEFMNFFGKKTLNDMLGIVVKTTFDEKGYLCFKAY